MKIVAPVKRYTEDYNIGYTPHRKGDISELKAWKAKITYCCKRMETAFDEHFVVLGEYDGIGNKNADVNITHCSAYPEGAFWDEMKIDFCPFCAEKIEVELVNEEASK